MFLKFSYIRKFGTNMNLENGNIVCFIKNIYSDENSTSIPCNNLKCVSLIHNTHPSGKMNIWLHYITICLNHYIR